MKALCRLTLWGVLGSLLAQGLSSAQPQSPNTDKPAVSAPAKPPEAKVPDRDRYAFEMRNKPWSGVFEWLTDRTQLPLISNIAAPPGTFNFINPRVDGKEPRKYTVAEIIDIINDGLLPHKYLLLRRPTSFTIWPADEKIPGVLVPQVSVDELDGYGKNQVVKVTIKLENIVVEDFAPEVKKMMSDFGEVIPIGVANQLILQDNVDSLRKILRTIDTIEKGEGSRGAETFAHKCLYVKAAQAEMVLKNFLGDSRQIIEMTRSATSSPFPGAPPGSGGPPGSSGPGGFSGRSDRDRGQTTSKVRVHHITSDERTNTVYVNGPPDKIAQAKQVMAKLDVPQFEGQRPLVFGDPFMQTYNVAGGNAEALVKTFQDVFRTSPSVKISAISTSQVMVWAGPEDHMTFAKYLTNVMPAPASAVMIPLTVLEATKVAETIKGMFGDAKGGAPYVEGDAARNVLMVRGTAEQVKEVKAVVQAIGENPTAYGAMRVITLDKGSAVTLADALQRLLPQMRANPVKVILPGNAESDIESAPRPQQPKLPPPQLTPPDPKKVGTLSPISFEGGLQLVDPAAPKKPADKDAKKGEPSVTITAFGNKLVVLSEDPEALALVQELVRLLTQTQVGEGDFEVIRLRNAAAGDIARILDEAFNGKAAGATPGRGGPGGGSTGGFNPFAGGLSGIVQSVIGGSPGQRIERVRIVADPSINALIVRATPLDMLTIRNLLTKHLDTGITDSDAVPRTRMIGPLKYAHAMDVAGVIQNVYRDYMGQNSQNMRVGGFSGFGFSPFSGGMFGQQQQQQQQKPAALAVGIDERSNSLIVSCATPLYDDILKLVDMLEKAASDSPESMKVVSIKGIDPLLVEQALDAIQGKTPAMQSRTGSNQFGSGFNSGNTSGFRGGFQGGGLPGGGFVPGGGFTPGGGFPGGGFPGGGISPGGGFRGTGGGGTGGGRPRGGIRGGGADNRGPDFFAPTVKDDRNNSILFDPTDLKAGPEMLQPVSFQEAQPQDKKDPAPKDKKDARDNPEIAAPRLPVTGEALPELGLMILRAKNPQDLEAAMKLIEFIQRVGSGSEINIELIPLKFADPSSVTNTLNLLFSRVSFGPNANVNFMPQGGRFTQTTAQITPGGGANLSTTGASAPNLTNASVVLIPLPRQNAILAAIPKSRAEDLRREIAKLDVPILPNARANSFALKQQSAARVAQLLTTFYATRYPSEQQAQHQIRVTSDETTNTVIVQASPADLDEIRQLIERLDTTPSQAVNDLKIVPLKNALAEDLAITITRAIFESLSTTGVGGAGQAGGAGGFPGAGGLGQAGGFGQLGGAAGGAGQGAQGNVQSGTTRTTKYTSLSFIAKNKEVLKAGLLDDIRITAEPRTNSLVIAAPESSMQLILAMIRELDVVPAARAEINVFTLRKADAAQLAATLQQLFLGTGVRTGTGAAGGLGAGGAAGGGQAQQFGAGQAGAAGTQQRAPLQLTIGGQAAEGAPLIDVRVTVDERTNSLIVAGSRNDLQIIEALISRLEDADIQSRRNEAFRLRNAQAADVANALTDFLKKSNDVLKTGNQLTAFQEIQRDVVVVPEPISNTLLISATPQYFDMILRLISQLDMLPPQVAIQVLVAEVDFADNNEFGVELGLQSPVLFRRGLFPFGALGGSNTITAPATGNSLVPQGVTVNSTFNPVANPGFAFNNVLQGLGNNPAVNPSVVGYQSISNLGVGRISPTNNIGGFVFSASSDTVSILVRALRVQNRIDILSRPQITTLDNQTALINVGQDVPFVGQTTVTANGLSQQSIDRKTVGVILQVTPRISPDGRVLMRVTPEISSVVPQPVALGNGVIGTAFNIQHIETTVSAYDGETVVLGGLISKRDTKNENKVPWLGDLPYVGAAFRYRTQTRSKTELIVILTPHIIRNKADAEKILAEEARKMDWVLSDVLKTHGPHVLDGTAPPTVNGGLPPIVTPLEETPLPRVMPMEEASKGMPQLVPTAPSIKLQEKAAGPIFPEHTPAGVPVQRLTPTSYVPMPADAGAGKTSTSYASPAGQGPRPVPGATATPVPAVQARHNYMPAGPFPEFQEKKR